MGERKKGLAPDEVILCRECGRAVAHSRVLAEATTRECSGQMEIISKKEWRVFTAQHPAKLTDLGRAALREREG